MKTLREIVAYAEDSGHYMLRAILLLSLGAVCGLAPYYATYQLILRLVESSLTTGFCFAMAGLVLVGMAGRTLLNEYGLEASHKLAYNSLAGMRRKTAKKLLDMPLGSVESWGSGALKKVFAENIEEMELILAHGLPEGVGNIVGLLAAVVAIFVADWRMALLCLAVLPLGFAAILLMGRSAREKLPVFYQGSREMNSTIVEYVRGMEVIKVFGQADNAFARYKKSIENYTTFSLDWYGTSWKYMAFYDVVLPSTLLFLLPAGVLFFAGGGLTAGALVFCLMLALAIGPMLSRVVMFIPLLPNLAEKFKPLQVLLREAELPRTQAPATPASYDVAFENVRFAYKEDVVLDGVSFTAKQGAVTAVVGASGAGKSTVAKLLCRFWDVQQGAVTIGGVPITNLSFGGLMDTVSYVSQDNFLFDMSILENLRLGKPEATDDEVVDIAQKAGCHDFIMRLPHGYNTIMSEGGGSLSGGEKQRISIARAMLKNTPIVILDEATASVDPDNEGDIQQAIGALIEGKTLVIIAHRLTTIQNADQILVVDQKHILESGTHEELLSQKGKYFNLWQRRQKAGGWKIEA